MSYNKYTKYQIMDAKFNKNLVNEELLVQKLPLKVVEPQPPKWFKEFAEKQNNINLLLANQIKELQTTPPKWFRGFAEKQDKVNETIFNFIEKQEQFNTEQRQFNEYVRDVFRRNDLK